MDTAVALVQDSLQINGYFTVAEYPVLEAARRGVPGRSVTDLDILALRFAGAGHEVIRGQTHGPIGGRRFAPDAELGRPPDRPDMIVGEVKEGAARFNAATRDQEVLEVALARFGCCSSDHAAALAGELLSRGRVESPVGHSIRLVAFGSSPDGGDTRRWTTVSMPHVVRFLRRYLRQHWEVLHRAQMKDPALGVLALLEKWDEGSPSDVRSGSGPA